MAIRFKFRSSVNFDSVSIGDQPSISFRDFKSNVLRLKNLNTCQGFDLVFSDALTHQEYVDEDFQIPTGSCVIIKRVPAGATHTDMMPLGSPEGTQSQKAEIVNPSPPAIAGMNNMDDFGVDLYSVPGATTLACDLDIDPSIQVDKMCIENERILEPFKGVFHKVEVCDLSEAIAEGDPHDGMEGNTTEMEIIPRTDDFRQLEKLTKDITPSLQKIDLLPELKCSICDSFCKDALMIPCCQHSFCEICIRLVLVEMERCPKCHSTKYKVEDLLPNVSLRQVIEYFLDSQILMTGSPNALHQYASDGESEAQAKNVLYSVPTCKKDSDTPHSPCPTETGSNNIMEETCHDVIFRERDNASHGGVDSHLGAKSYEKRHAPIHQKRIGNFNTNLEKCQHTNEEVLFSSKEKRSSRFDAVAAGGEKRSKGPRRHRKGNMTCYMCGSPDHLIRDCPATSTSYAMLQRGIAMPVQPIMAPNSLYWNAASLHHGPTSQFRNHGMIPFKMAMFPSGPCSFPIHMPFMFGGVPSLSQAFPVNDEILSVDEKKGHSLNGSGGWWSYCHPEQSSLEVEDFHCSSFCCSKERRNKQPHRRSRSETERNNCVTETDSIQVHHHHQYYKERVKRKRAASGNKKSHHGQCSPPESDLEQCCASDRRQHKLTMYGSTKSKYMVESVDDDDLGHSRWQMKSIIDDNAEGDYYYYKRKRTP